MQYILRFKCYYYIQRWLYKLYSVYKILTVHVYQHCHSEIWLHGVVVVSSQTRVCTICMTSIQLMNYKTFGCCFFVVVFVSVRYFLCQIHDCSRTERRGDFTVRGIPLHPWFGFTCNTRQFATIDDFAKGGEGDISTFSLNSISGHIKKKGERISVCVLIGTEHSSIQMKSNYVNKSLFGSDIYVPCTYVSCIYITHSMNRH